ncbi:MAG: hypothetical protein ACK44W_05870, partial [Planctomycetota bacterium]
MVRFWAAAAAAALGAAAGSQEAGQRRTICFALYTTHRGILKLTAQLYPLAAGDPRTAALEVMRDGAWREVATAPVVEEGWTVHFRVEGWDASRSVRYRVRHGASSYEGLVRRDPVDKEVVVAAAFTGNSPGPGGGRISRKDLVEYVAKVDPDVLLFTGDQVYDHNDHTRHWIRFGEDFGEVIRDRPTVTIPDDHDVGHPNLWGQGGRPARQDWEGGYLKPPSYVNMVQRQQTWHLPDPYDPTPVEQGITVYYTSLNVGGVDFAILEDRKWKTGCGGLRVVERRLGPRPDHVTSKEVDPKEFDVPGAELLGERQLRFLRVWGQDWRGAVFKAVVSQTIFSMAQNYHSKDESFYVADLDSNGWPQSGRNAALREMRRAFAFHICGDQHLGAIVQYGIDEWGDAGYAFCVPSIANLYPRWWKPERPGLDREPGAPEYTGKFHDGLGNKMTVWAVSNPSKTGREPAELHDRAPGWGLVRFDKKKRTITMECWPRMIDPTDPAHAGLQYPGWPHTIHQLDNYGRAAAAWLPTLE